MFHFYLISRDSQIGKRNKEKKKKKEKSTHCFHVYFTVHNKHAYFFFCKLPIYIIILNM